MTSRIGSACDETTKNLLLLRLVHQAQQEKSQFVFSLPASPPGLIKRES